ncbi:MAG: lysophospholipid acyltransferase family protein [Magnetospirillum sp.]|nr:lysophospholipid acyltransferase family protein [Magnetospirillum sp.]
MGLAKRIGKNERIRGALCWLVAQYVRLVWLTGRWRVVGGDIPARFWDRGEPFILAFWHGRLLMMPKSWRGGMPIHMLISQHRDGQLIARTVGHFGIHTVEGSTTRGGAGALRAMLKALKGGECIGITPDGPKGPRMRASDGIVAVARLSGCPVIPATYAAAGARRLGSWDRFLIPLPFSRGLILWGEPITVARDGDEAAARQAIEDAMNAQTAEADRLMGMDPVQPA